MRSVLITAASTGIGRATALRLLPDRVLDRPVARVMRG
jgi:NAD(P)-dependent dehydrogenase (short-subunit alcohol dehydrogenase family)